MEPIRLDQVIGLDRYERERDEFRRRIIALKKHRRVSVGEDITFVFENRDTVFFQIQEMLRAERITDLDKVREELDCYNELIPHPGELSSTMLIEITEQEHIRERLVRLHGIEEAVRFEIGDVGVKGEFEAGRSKEDKLSAVQYVRFAFDAAARQRFVSGRDSVRLVVDHPHYQAATLLDDVVRRALADDFADGRTA
ncbi:MAG: DUF3501 family protein [Deltaproteobacteria bacterium]|nr:DUF3501 family protein [Deltaproteobacteria bacterium]MBI3389109.1 DUF3501 family protein [Deltaproteobacteria bacterium]